MLRFEFLKRDDLLIVSEAILSIMKQQDHIWWDRLASLYGSILLIYSISEVDKNIDVNTDPYVRREIKKIGEIISLAMKESKYLGFSMKVWMHLANLFLVGRYFNLYYLCRKKSSELMLNIDLNIKKIEIIQSYIALCAESPDEKLDNIFDWYQECPADVAKMLRPQMRALTLLREGKEAYRSASKSITSGEKEQEFAKLVNGKNIAIVGPVDVGLMSGEEIDSYDLIIRFNHTSKSIYDSKKFGSKTDISYYTDTAFKKLIQSNKDNLKGLKFAIPQNLSAKNFLIDESKFACKFRPQYRRSNNIFFKSYGNAVQRLMLDFLRFDTASIKLFNMNLWLTPHDKNYLARRDIVDSYTFIYHDVVTNFLFMKNLYRIGAFQLDPVMMDVVEMDVEGYIENLSRIYG